MVDDPSAHPDIFPTEKKQEKERQRLFRIIEDLVKWENTTNETVLQQARDEIWQSWRVSPQDRTRFLIQNAPDFLCVPYSETCSWLYSLACRCSPDSSEQGPAGLV